MKHKRQLKNNILMLKICINIRKNFTKKHNLNKIIKKQTLNEFYLKNN